MSIASIARFISSAFLALAVALVAYGLFGLSQFARYTGAYYDDRLVVFDNGFYPFMWGVILLVIGLLARLHYRRPAMLLAASSALVILTWKRVTVPAPIVGLEIFPSADLLDFLLAITGVLLALALVDRPIERAIRRALRRGR